MYVCLCMRGYTIIMSMIFTRVDTIRPWDWQIMDRTSKGTQTEKKGTDKVSDATTQTITDDEGDTNKLIWL